jgi:hypothetical protein
MTTALYLLPCGDGKIIQNDICPSNRQLSFFLFIQFSFSAFIFLAFDGIGCSGRLRHAAMSL